MTVEEEILEMKYLAVLVLWLLFVLAQPFAFVFALLALCAGKSTYASNILKAQDRATAAFLGFSGTKTVSAECGASDSRLCHALCWLLGKLLEEDHCRKEAARQ